MKVLTLTQPIATLMATGAKRVETRSFKTSYRGEIAIHAAGAFGGLPEIMRSRGFKPTTNSADFKRLCLSEPFHSVLSAHMQSLGPQSINTYWDEIPMAAIVCVVDLFECRHTQGEYGSLLAPWIEKLSEQERAFGNYGPNRYGWFTENLRRLREPVPCKGRQGLRDLPADIETLVRAQL